MSILKNGLWLVLCQAMLRASAGQESVGHVVKVILHQPLVTLGSKLSPFLQYQSQPSKLGLVLSTAGGQLALKNLDFVLCTAEQSAVKNWDFCDVIAEGEYAFKN